ncbi:MAG: hypothetical protein C0423_19595 [Methylibium sp.]|nr:hypothetical protein [Methylibium sp.]
MPSGTEEIPKPVSPAVIELTLREIPNFPPPWSYVCAQRPEDRRGRLAARQAFVSLKLCFTRAAAEARGSASEELRRLVRQACEPIELWLLRAPLLAALPDDIDQVEQHRLAIEQALRQVYPGRQGQA